MWAVLDASAIATAVTRRADGRILMANKACLELLGWEESEIVGRTMVDVGFWARAEQRDAALEQLRTNGTVRDLEHEVTTKAGETIVVVTSIAPVTLDGEACLIGHLHDITQRRRLEAQLRASDERFRQLADALHLGFLLREVETWEVLYASPAIETIYGVDRDELARDPHALERVIHPEDRERLVARRGAITAATDFEFRIVRPDGATRWVRARAEPVRADDGEVTRLASLSEDVTEEHALQELLRESEGRFRMLAENSSDIIARSTPDGVIRYISPGCRALYGYEPEEMMGHSGWEFVHPDDQARLAEELTAQATLPGELTNVYRVCRKDGSAVWIEAKTRGLRAPGGDDVVEFQTVARDISERMEADAVIRRAREEAEQANLAKSEFLSRMSHELRTPLHAILGFGELLDRDDLTASQRESLEHITKGGYHLLDLINEVLDISRLERGELALSLEPVHAGEIVGEALGMIGPLAAARHVAVVPPIAEQLDWCVRADRQRLKQVLLNLLSNAVKYNREGGRVSVHASRDGPDRARIEVQDTGIGIDEPSLERVFAAFDRLGAEATEVEGTGLGLTLTKRLIEAMDGTVGVQSEVGRGTTFWLDLEVVAAPDVPRRATLAPVRADTAPRPALPARTVLYIEDNPSNIRLVEAILAQRPEVTLLVATQGGLGLELAAEHRPALVLLDLNLPDMSGEEVLRRLRGDDRTKDVRIVMLSADATPGQVERLRRSGAHDYLTKPFEIERFLGAIDGRVEASDVSDAAGDEAADGPLQLDVLQHLRDLYPDGLRDFIELFLSDSPPRVDAIESAARAGDAEGVRQGAHGLRGSCAIVGAHRVDALLERVEEVIRGGGFPSAEDVAAIRVSYDEAAEALRRELDTC